VTSGKTTVSLYGKNILNKVTFGISSPQAFFPRASFVPLNKGRVLGIEVRYSY
jgi:iron complex outermembrane receptor protein